MSDVGSIVSAIHALERNLSVLNGNIAVVNAGIGQVAQNVSAVGDNVAVVSRQQADTRERLEELYAKFQAFVAADTRQKERQFAATRIIEVRQELEKRFGHYDEVRRHATGLLQATDLAIVRQETMRTRSEELMLACPGYWLAPSLVALVHWIADNRPVAQDALTEALKRDDSKASLFFSLVCRRAKRAEACSHWLVHYFRIQNPIAMDREVVVMVDALANGVFGDEAVTTCTAVINEWLTLLEGQGGILEEQRKCWANALDLMAPAVAPDEYPALRNCSTTWPELEVAISTARRNEVILSFFIEIFTGETAVPLSLELAVDRLLESLVTNFDDEELPLRREELMLQLTVDEQGDKEAASRRFEAQSNSLDERTNFAAMLTSSALNPESFGANRATQRYAISRSRRWVASGFSDLIARDRARVPGAVELRCGSWKGASGDASNGPQLWADLAHHYARRIEAAVAALQISGWTWATTVAGAFFGLVFGAQGGGATLFGLLIMAVSGLYFYARYSSLETARQRTRQALEKERDEAQWKLRLALDELTALRREIATGDAKAAQVFELLNRIEFFTLRPRAARAGSMDR